MSTVAHPSRVAEARRMAERGLARATVLLTVGVAVPVVIVAAVLRGGPGLLGAGIGAGLVLLMFACSGLLLARSHRLAPAAFLGVALVGTLLRFLGYGALLVVLEPVAGIDRGSLALGTAVVLATSLGWELRAVARTPQLFWLETNERTTP